MEKDRSHRFSSVAELAHALLPYAPRRARNSVERISRVIGGEAYVSPSAERSASEAPAALAASTRSTQASWGNTGANKGKSTRWLLLVGAAFLAALAALGAVNALRPSARSAPSASANEPQGALEIAAAKAAPPAVASSGDEMTIGALLPVASATMSAPPSSALPSASAHLPKVVAHSLAPRAVAKPNLAPALAAVPAPAPTPAPAKAKKPVDVFDDRK
jgi:serine/threonine-protein kinase